MDGHHAQRSSWNRPFLGSRRPLPSSSILSLRRSPAAVRLRSRHHTQVTESIETDCDIGHMDQVSWRGDRRRSRVIEDGAIPLRGSTGTGSRSGFLPAPTVPTCFGGGIGEGVGIEACQIRAVRRSDCRFSNHLCDTRATLATPCSALRPAGSVCPFRTGRPRSLFICSTNPASQNLCISKSATVRLRMTVRYRILQRMDRHVATC